MRSQDSAWVQAGFTNPWKKTEPFLLSTPARSHHNQEELHFSSQITVFGEFSSMASCRDCFFWGRSGNGGEVVIEDFYISHSRLGVYSHQYHCSCTDHRFPHGFWWQYRPQTSAWSLVEAQPKGINMASGGKKEPYSAIPYSSSIAAAALQYLTHTHTHPSPQWLSRPHSPPWGAPTAILSQPWCFCWIFFLRRVRTWSWMSRKTEVDLGGG